MKQIIRQFVPPILYKGAAVTKRWITKKSGPKTVLHLPANKENKGDSPYDFIIMKTSEDIDKFIQKTDEAAEISDDELRKVFSKYHCDYPFDMPDDPYSDEYYSKVMEMYKTISGRTEYLPYQDEKSPFDFEAAKFNSFPYATQSYTTIGDQIIAQGFLIKMMQLKSGSSVLEFGPGWGETTLHFARAGYKVTAVDIEPAFLNLIKFKCELNKKHVEVYHSDMLEFTSDTKYDAVVFYECFHHCFQHTEMLQKLNKLIIKDGIIVFAGEPIANIFPYPWGIRLDGQSVWSIRKFGWMELGFTDNYFFETLKKYGWSCKKYISHDCPWQSVIIAKRC